MPTLATFFKMLVVSSILLCFVLFAYTSTFTYFTDNKESYHLNSNNNTKYILYWTGERNFRLGLPNEGDAIFETCKYKNCFVTENRNLLPVDEFAAILFYISTSTKHPKETLPPKRNPQQRYVFANAETPLRFHDTNVHYVFDNFFNWTMSYRFDSDVVRRHGRVIENKTDYQMPAREAIAERKGTVAWIVSNCRSVDRREQLAQNLAKYIPVDVYGKCGTLKCPDDDECYDYVARNYKFYLSFENSHCKDYTTEKFIKALERDIIPVVYGGGDYAKIAPKHSYINVEDFNSAEILGSYLKILEQDLDSYLEYFEWKKDYVVERAGLIAMCRLCEMLNDPNEPPKVYEDIKHWWFSEEMSKCKSGERLPEIALEDV